MLSLDTVFVIGAGASAEVSLPLGRDLASTIGKKMDIDGLGDKELLNELRPLAESGDDHAEAAARIRDGVILANSIDDFLDQNRDDTLIKTYGKAAIAKSIVEAERKSSMFYADGQHIDFTKIANTWYVGFFRGLQKGIARTKLDKIFDRSTFISFNYDRCLEFFLFHALQQSNGIIENNAAEICNAAKIFHAYGCIGGLPYQNNGTTVPFSTDQIKNKCVGLASQIRTYTEEVEQDVQFNAIRTAVFKAERVVFLGFGFHQQNLAVLGGSNTSLRRNIIATAHGLSSDNLNVYREAVVQQFKCDPVIFSGCTCRALFDSYFARIFG
jgi:hypothetical protein